MTGGGALGGGGTGGNLAAGMSGGIAYVFDPARELERGCNLELVELEPLDQEDLAVVHDLIARHVELTGSHLGARLLSAWTTTSLQLTKVMPRDYKRALADAVVSRPVAVLNSLEVAHG